MIQLNEKNKLWVDEQWDKLNRKLQKVAIRSRGKIPFVTDEKVHNDCSETEIYCWTNGFWPGLMWLMYVGTQNEEYRKTAEITEEQLDEALLMVEKLSHDVGFMWKLAAGPDFQLTGSMDSWRRLRRAADHLMARYNPGGGFIRAWDWGAERKGKEAGYAIIDCMMNLPLLYWASEQAYDPRFKFAAMNHADKTMENHVRPDGSVRHIVVYDPENGDVVNDLCGQGYELGSSWSRGQAWGLYGFTLSYIHTGKQEYLDTAKRIAHYFISCVCDDWLPKADFRAPEEPVYYDTSAGACAACGLIELARILPEYESRLYLNAALNILKAMEKNFADWSEDTDFIMDKATTSYRYQQNTHIIYADYYFAEAIYKLKGFDVLFW